LKWLFPITDFGALLPNPQSRKALTMELRGYLRVLAADWTDVLAQFERNIVGKFLSSTVNVSPDCKIGLCGPKSPKTVESEGS